MKKDIDAEMGRLVYTDCKTPLALHDDLVALKVGSWQIHFFIVEYYLDSIRGKTKQRRSR